MDARLTRLDACVCHATCTQEGRSHLALVSNTPELTKKALASGDVHSGKGAPIGQSSIGWGLPHSVRGSLSQSVCPCPPRDGPPTLIGSASRVLCGPRVSLRRWSV
jgi:hypothetical protein